MCHPSRRHTALTVEMTWGRCDVVRVWHDLVRGAFDSIPKLDRARNPGSFFHEDELIRGDVLQRIHLPARPSDLKQIHFASASEPEVNTKVALREVASAASNLIDLLMRLAFANHGGDTLDTRANTTSI